MIERAIGIGCMRLSERGDGVAATTLRAALEAGATLLDTADVYGDGARGAHGNERLVARVLASWPGARPLVVTKGGLVRARGRHARYPSLARTRSAHAARDQRPRARGAARRLAGGARDRALLALYVERERLDVARSMLVGTSAAHRAMADGAGVAFTEA